VNEDPNARLIHDLKAEVDRLRQLLRLQDLDPGNLWAYPAVATHGLRWLGSRVVSVLDSGAEGHGVQLAAATLSGNSLRQTVHTHCACVHQAAKLVAAVLRVAGVTAGLAESNGSLPPGL